MRGKNSRRVKSLFGGQIEVVACYPVSLTCRLILLLGDAVDCFGRASCFFFFSWKGVF